MKIFIPVTPAWLKLLVVLCLCLITSDLPAQCTIQWQPSSGASGSVHAFATLVNGDLVAGGNFTSIEGTPAASIARQSGSTWLPLGSGIQGTVRALAMMPNGDIVAGGDLTMAGGVAVNHIARWNGATWSALGAGFNGIGGVFVTAGVHALQVLPNGDLVAAGHFLNAGSLLVNHIARWDGSAWSSLAGGVLSGGHLSPSAEVFALALLPGGDLVAAGSFAFAGSSLTGKIARWNGLAWSSMTANWVAGPGPLRKLLVLANGDLIGSGSYSAFANLDGPYVARWSGSSWQQMGTLNSVAGLGDGYVRAMMQLPDGDLLVGGHNVELSTSGTINLLLRWSGSSWTQVVGGQMGDVNALTMQANGAVTVGGNFTSVGGSASPGLARLESTCPASVATVGTSCVGSAGPHDLTASALPWLGGTFRAVTTGMPATSLAIAVTSLSSSTIPLSAVLPIGGAGCEGLVFAELADLLIPNAGQVESRLDLPNVPSFAGILLHHYTAVLEFDPLGNAVALTSSPRLVLNLGAF